MSIQLIRRLKEFDQPRLEQIYQNVFLNTEEGQLVLEDLKARFWEYAPAPDIRCVGQEDVLKHIKNMVAPYDTDKDDPAQAATA